jgi:hypothetical protein
MSPDLQHPRTDPPSGAEIRQARRARVRMLRRRVATGAVVSFLAAWGVVYAQMRLGDDPALGAGTAVAQTARASTDAAATLSGDDAGTASGDNAGTASGNDAATTGRDDAGTASGDSSTLVTAQS